MLFCLLENNVVEHLKHMILKILEEILVTYPNINQIQHKVYILPKYKIKTKMLKLRYTTTIQNKYSRYQII